MHHVSVSKPPLALRPVLRASKSKAALSHLPASYAEQGSEPRCSLSYADAANAPLAQAKQVPQLLKRRQNRLLNSCSEVLEAQIDAGDCDEGAADARMGEDGDAFGSVHESYQAATAGRLATRTAL